MLAKRWREHGDREAAHKLVTSHLRLVAKIAMGYRGYGLPISEVISEGNVGLMQAVKRFEPEKGFRLATYAMWWIKAAIQEYILRSWSLVKMGTTANQKKLFFNLRKAKSKISALEEGDMRPDQVKLIAKRLGVTEQDVVDMNRRLGGDASLNAPIREDGDAGEWQDWLVDNSASQETLLAESEQSENRHNALGDALTVLNDRERRIFEARRLAEDPITLEELADEFGVSRERVRQIEVRAFEKVQKAVKNRVAIDRNTGGRCGALTAELLSIPPIARTPAQSCAGVLVLRGSVRRRRGAAAGRGVARRCLGRKEPGFDAEAAPQRIHVEDRHAVRKQPARIATVESHEDCVWKRDLDRTPLDHVHSIIRTGAVFGRSLAAVPFHCALGEMRQHFRSQDCVAGRIALGLRPGGPGEISQPTGLETVLPGTEIDIGKIATDGARQVSVQLRMRIGED